MQSVLGIQCDEANNASAIGYERIQYPTRNVVFCLVWHMGESYEG